MIINQTIKNGFTVVNKTGAYFSLISAGGVVNVSLSEKGRTVLDTKMWVGMSIDKAIPFDEITIKGDDGAVEFWAGDVSMSNSRYSSSAAKAIRTDVKLVSGSKIIAGSDVTRTAVRVRSDKEVFVSGAGFKTGGWRVPAGEVIEIPLAGVVSAYKRDAFIDYSAPSPIEQDDSMYESGAFANACTYISEDEQTRVYVTNVSTGGSIRATEDGGLTWKTVLAGSVYSYEFDQRTGIHYALQLKGSLAYNGTVVFSRSYDGIKWETMHIRNHSFPDGAGMSRQTYRGLIVNGWYQVIFDGMVFCCDIELGNVVVTGVKFNGINCRLGAWLDENLKVGVFQSLTDSKLVKTEDGGLTWRTVFDGKYGSSFVAASDGVHLFESTNAHPLISEDGGETWITVNTSSYIGNRVTHVKDNLWIGFYQSYVRYVDMPNGVGSEIGGGLINTPPLDIKSVFIKPNGSIYTAPVSAIGFKTSISVTGDLSAARVEVMELLS